MVWALSILLELKGIALFTDVLGSHTLDCSLNLSCWRVSNKSFFTCNARAFWAFNSLWGAVTLFQFCKSYSRF